MVRFLYIGLKHLGILSEEDKAGNLHLEAGGMKLLYD